MRGHFSNPFDSAVFHGRVGIDAFCDGACDDALLHFAEEFDASLLGSDDLIDFSATLVEISRYRFLFGEGRNAYFMVLVCSHT